MQSNPLEILKIVRTARRWAMRNRNVDEHGTHLCGMCAIAAARLLTLLHSAGYEAEVVIWDTEDEGGHCHVETEKYLLDITATQFGRKPIEMHPKGERPDEIYWRGAIRVKSVAALRLELDNRGWPEEQLPSLP